LIGCGCNDVVDVYPSWTGNAKKYHLSHIVGGERLHIFVNLAGSVFVTVKADCAEIGLHGTWID
jgi:hypothetical protein